MIQLKNKKVILEFTLDGSAFTRFEYLGKDINPLDWKLPEARLPETNTGSFPFRGHFLCLGTWGMPTEGEKLSGIKFYGEVNTERWTLEESSENPDGSLEAVTTCLSPVEKLDVKRIIHLYEDAPVVRVTELVTNGLPIGRPYNMLQHATFGGEFINQKTILDTNAGKGFSQNGNLVRENYADIEETSYLWPTARLADQEFDLRLSRQIPKSFVSSHIFGESAKQGWATLVNREKGMLIGYVWDLDDYPWLNVWHQFEEGKVKGRAIEFATCGMWKSFEYMMSNDSRFFGQNSFEFIDAGETISKTYHMFLLPVGKEFKGVESVEREADGIIIRWDNGKSTSEEKLLFKTS